jgi:hypothetical protein
LFTCITIICCIVITMIIIMLFPWKRFKFRSFTFICYHYLWSPWFLYNKIVLYSHKRVKHRWQIAKQYLNVWLSLLWLQYVIRCLMETSWTKKI